MSATLLINDSFEIVDIADGADPFNSAVLDTTQTTPVFVVKGVAFTVKYPTPVKKVIAAICVYKCTTCKERAKQMVGQVGPAGPLFLCTVCPTTLSSEPPLASLRNLATECIKIPINEEDPPKSHTIDLLVECGTPTRASLSSSSRCNAHSASTLWPP